MAAPLAQQPYALLTPSNVTHTASPVQGGRRVSLFQRFVDTFGWIGAYPSRMAAIDELQRLSDRELADIGLTRSQVRHVFARTAD